MESHDFGMTPREHDVLEPSARGLSNVAYVDGNRLIAGYREEESELAVSRTLETRVVTVHAGLARG